MGASVDTLYMDCPWMFDDVTFEDWDDVKWIKLRCLTVQDSGEGIDTASVVEKIYKYFKEEFVYLSRIVTEISKDSIITPFVKLASNTLLSVSRSSVVSRAIDIRSRIKRKLSR